MNVAAIIIGRNEGERLVRCLASVTAECAPVIYVDSGSTDGSVAAAEAAGARVVALDMNRPFTAARARNEGFAVLGETGEFVQFIDGDCELQQGWIAAGRHALAERPNAAIVAGRVRERDTARSVYNRLADLEWDTPVGETEAVGGIFMVRAEAFRAVGGFDPTLIAGEEPELCQRLRRAGWTIWRMDAEMTLHDAAMTRFGQFWRRAERGGHAAAEGASMHGRGPDRLGVGQTRRALLWGLALPLAACLGALIHPAAWLLLLAYPAQVVRLALRRGGGRGAWEWAWFNTLGKFAEAKGVLRYHWGRLTSRRRGLIEYK
ncbi:glycosyltransferase [Paracoccus sp. TK19116]|uniref:Glycosyltransferase n=1 Tax=Paracoccus albicereus TaxID=2922394 RepID=A0ABT1MPQ9_9RHOB|nr:glycosyltransferase [Paracoccus albicereus]MCQ0970290.1 glycosyltransferase [Paracoccus albicereus]